MRTRPVEAVIERGELRWLPLAQLRPNPWNPNRMDQFMFAKELESIRRFGMANPIVARVIVDERDEPLYWEIIDGEHRLRALEELGWTEAPVWDLGLVSNSTAKQLTIVLNETKGSPEKQKLSELLKDLLKSETTTELLNVLPYSKEKFDQLVDVPAFNWEEFEERQPRIGVDTWVERIYRLPIDAAKVLDEAIARAKEGDDTPDGIALERIAADFLAR